MVFPNPTEDILNVTLTTPAQVQILNMSGQIVFSQWMNNGTQSIDVDSLSNGLYILSITQENAQQFIKVQKN